MSLYTQYWSTKVGKFVYKSTGRPLEEGLASFTGTQDEWNECFWESIFDIMNTVGIARPKARVHAHPDAMEYLKKSITMRQPDEKLLSDKSFVGVSWGGIRLYQDDSRTKNEVFVFEEGSSSDRQGQLIILDMV